MAKEAYMTVAVPGTKKVSVCARRIGTRDRLSVIAVANTEDVAEKIVDALNLQQGKLTELEVPAQRVLTEVREQLSLLRIRLEGAERKNRDKDTELSQLKQQLRLAAQSHDETSRELARVKAKESA